MKGITFGLISGVAGVAIWTGATYWTGHEVGWLTWGVGALVGYGVFFVLGTGMARGLGLAGMSRQALEAAYQSALLVAMARVGVSDGAVDESELGSIRSILQEVSGLEVAEEKIRLEAENAAAEDTELIPLLERLSPHLDTAQRETIVRSAIQVGLANGSVGDEEQRLVSEIATAVDVSDSHLHGILAGVVAG
jgi:uncharacterized tellurite resistance protein B-like protein